MVKNKESAEQRIKRLQLGRELIKENTRREKAETKKLKEQAKFSKQETKRLKALSKLKKRHSVGSKIFKGVTKAIKPTAKASRQLINIGRGFSTGGVVRTEQQRVQENPGRPAGVFKHLDPFTKKPIPATVYYQRKKEYERVAQQVSNQADLQAIKQLAQRGIPPSQAKQIIDQRQLQSAGVQPQQLQQNIPTRNVPTQLQTNSNAVLQRMRMQQINQQMQQQMPQQIPQQMPTNYPSQAVRPIWRNREGQVDTDWGLFGRKQVLRGTPQSYWN